MSKTNKFSVDELLKHNQNSSELTVDVEVNSNMTNENENNLNLIKSFYHKFIGDKSLINEQNENLWYTLAANKTLIEGLKESNPNFDLNLNWIKSLQNNNENLDVNKSKLNTDASHKKRLVIENELKSDTGNNESNEY
jgi:hypothetical protein